MIFFNFYVRDLLFSQLLLSYLNIDINKTCFEGNTPFHIVIKKGNLDIIKILLDQDKININKINEDGEIPICYAIKEKNLEILKMLLN